MLRGWINSSCFVHPRSWSAVVGDGWRLLTYPSLHRARVTATAHRVKDFAVTPLALRHALHLKYSFPEDNEATLQSTRTISNLPIRSVNVYRCEFTLWRDFNLNKFRLRSVRTGHIHLVYVGCTNAVRQTDKLALPGYWVERSTTLLNIIFKSTTFTHRKQNIIVWSHRTVMKTYYRYDKGYEIIP